MFSFCSTLVVSVASNIITRKKKSAIDVKFVSDGQLAIF